jgi:hypothetical protein
MRSLFGGILAHTEPVRPTPYNSRMPTRVTWPVVFDSERGMDMSIEVLRNFFFWCAVINYGILVVWFLMFACRREWIHRFHGRWFRLSSEQFDAIHYAGMSVFKVGIFLFNLGPYVALCIVG